ncbi:MAG: hypothetical protein GX133_04910 [Syntrophomonadaceae bacterium]|nr:hypothetical protein [Syntrophomonadaceae bacterium]
MSIFGKAVKGTLGVVAGGLSYVIIKSARAIQNIYGDSNLVKTASDVGSSSVRITADTLKMATDIVDGGLEAGVGHLVKNEDLKTRGLATAQNAGKDITNGVVEGMVYTAAVGASTASSAFNAGRHYVTGDKTEALEEFDVAKGLAKHLGRTVAIGLLALGRTDTDRPGDRVGKNGQASSTSGSLDREGVD